MRSITAPDRHGVTSRKGVATRAWVQVGGFCISCKLDFGRLGRITQHLAQVINQGARDFNDVLLWGRHAKSGPGPQGAAHEGQGVGERRVVLGVPGCLSDGARPGRDLVVGQERDEGKQAQEGGRDAADGPVRPLALRFDAEMVAHFMEGHFNRPYTLHPYPPY